MSHESTQTRLNVPLNTPDIWAIPEGYKLKLQCVLEQPEKRSVECKFVQLSDLMFDVPDNVKMLKWYHSMWFITVFHMFYRIVQTPKLQVNRYVKKLLKMGE